MDIEKEFKLMMTRRTLFARASVGIGTAALASLLNPDLFAETAEIDPKTGGLKGLPHFTPKAKRVIFLHQSGAPSQIELFDYKRSSSSTINLSSISCTRPNCPPRSAWVSESRG